MPKTQKKWDSLWINGNLWGIGTPENILPRGACAVKNGQIAWVGLQSDLAEHPESLATQVHSLEGRWLLPGLIDSHTHLVFAGNRAQEFAKRLRGVSYETIAREGGGILSTVAATRQASVLDLTQSAAARLQQMQLCGVTTVEIKSGYGLDHVTEEHMLQTANALAAAAPVNVVRTFLGAHTVPPEYKDHRSEYLAFLTQKVLPSLVQQRLVDMVDVFCDTIAFTAEETAQLFQAAQKHELLLRLHVDQLSCTEGLLLLRQFPICSADHLEYTNEAGIQLMAQHDVVANLLPTAFYTLREKQKPPIELLRQHKVKMAIATDCNPGSSPCTSLLLTMNMACQLLGLTPDECLLGVTQHAAQALGRHQQLGSLEPGKQADFSIWSISHPHELCYWLGYSPLETLVHRGIPYKPVRQFLPA